MVYILEVFCSLKVGTGTCACSVIAEVVSFVFVGTTFGCCSCTVVFVKVGLLVGTKSGVGGCLGG